MRQNLRATSTGAGAGPGNGSWAWRGAGRQEADSDRLGSWGALPTLSTHAHPRQGPRRLPPLRGSLGGPRRPRDARAPGPVRPRLPSPRLLPWWPRRGAGGGRSGLLLLPVAPRFLGTEKPSHRQPQPRAPARAPPATAATFILAWGLSFLGATPLPGLGTVSIPLRKRRSTCGTPVSGLTAL